MSDEQKPERRSVALTQKQLRAAVLYGRGYSCKEIGPEIGMSEQSTKNLLSRANRKVGARNSTQLAVMVALQRDRQQRGAA